MPNHRRARIREERDGAVDIMAILVQRLGSPQVILAKEARELEGELKAELDHDGNITLTLIPLGDKK